MYFLEPSVIVVDDKKNEIEGILNYYHEQGIGCKLFNPSYYDGDVMPEKSFSDVNLIFLDLYYSEKFDAEQCSNWVQSLVGEKSFFILVLWTKDIGKAQEVIEELKLINRLPFLQLVKSKTDFIVNTFEKYNFSKLFSEINAELDKVSGLGEIQVWKKNIRSTTNEIIGHLLQDPNPELLNNKLKKIITGHGGRAIERPENYDKKRAILFDALDSILLSNTKFHVMDEEISIINKENLYNLEIIQNTEIDRKLNSWFHFRLEKGNLTDPIYPGIIAEFKDNDWKKMYSIHDDKHVLEFLSKQSKDIKIQSIALLLSRPCDIAQCKYGKNLKLLSGLKIINPLRKANAKNEFQKGSTQNDFIKIYDHLYFSDSEPDVVLLFDFRYNFSVPEDVFVKEFSCIKVFNKELLSEMQVEYGSYSSRLGITTII